MSLKAAPGFLPVARITTLVILARVLAGGEDHQGGDDECGDDREQRRRDAEEQPLLVDALGQLVHRESSSSSSAETAAESHAEPSACSRWPVAAPVMAEPCSSGVMVAGSASATSRPRYITRRVSDRPMSSSRSAE